MGIFQSEVDVVNIAPVTITVRFDGQDKKMPPGPGRLPAVVIPFAQNQNPIMGSEDPLNPSRTGAKYLIGVVGTDDRIEPLTDAEWQTHLGKPCRMDMDAIFEEKYAGDPKARQVVSAKRKSSFSMIQGARSVVQLTSYWMPACSSMTSSRILVRA